MTGKITHIQQHTGEQGPYTSVYIKCDDGRTRSLYLVETNRNYHMWEKLLKRGNVLEGLVATGTWLDADARPSLYNDNQLSLGL